MRLLTGLLLLPLLGGCAGYAADYVRPRTIVAPDQLSRYGFGTSAAECMRQRLQANLSVWQLRQLADVAAAGRRSDGSALTPRDFAAVAANVTDPAVPRAVAQAGEACAPTPAAVAAAQPAPPLEAGPTAAAPAEGPPVTAPSAAAAAAPAAASTAWVNLGAAATGQAIAVQAASVRQEGANRSAWFRLTNPGQSSSTAVSYLLRIDCTARTINPMAFRQYGPNGAVAAERDHGPAGEGAMPVEAGTVMEIAFLALCT